MSSSAFSLTRLPKEVFQHTASYLNPVERASLGQTSKTNYNALLEQKMRTFQVLYQQLYHDLSQEGASPIIWSIPSTAFTLEKPQIQQALLESALQSHKLFLKILYGVKNGTFPNNPRSNKFRVLLPAVDTEDYLLIKHIKSAFYTQLSKDLLSANELSIADISRKYILLKDHLQPILIEEIKYLLKCKCPKSAFQIANYFHSQMYRKEAYKLLLYYTISQSPETRNALIDNMIEQEKIRKNASEAIIKECKSFRIPSETRKRKAAALLDL